MTANSIDLNCDMGESFGAYQIGMDESVIAYISSANIACGWHAGDPMVMDRTIRMAKENGVTLTEFRDILERDGYPYSKFRENLRKQLVINHGHVSPVRLLWLGQRGHFVPFGGEARLHIDQPTFSLGSHIHRVLIHAHVAAVIHHTMTKRTRHQRLPQQGAIIGIG